MLGRIVPFHLKYQYGFWVIVGRLLSSLKKKANSYLVR